ncbi:hypothetical protein V2J09_018430 [Rumex salicifolius]
MGVKTITVPISLLVCILLLLGQEAAVMVKGQEPTGLCIRKCEPATSPEVLNCNIDCEKFGGGECIEKPPHSGLYQSIIMGVKTIAVPISLLVCVVARTRSSSNGERAAAKWALHSQMRARTQPGGSPLQHRLWKLGRRRMYGVTTTFRQG